MAEKLHGMLNLSKIDKSLITTNSRGEKVIWVDMVPRKNGPDQYGSTHSLQQYNKDTKQVIYLGDFKPQQFGPSAPAASAPAQGNDDNDLPF